MPDPQEDKWRCQAHVYVHSRVFEVEFVLTMGFLNVSVLWWHHPSVAEDMLNDGPLCFFYG